MASPSGVFRGTVSALNGPQGAGVYVKVPKLNAGHAFGPCALTETAARLGTVTEASSAADTADTAVGDHGAHHHAMPHTHDLAGPIVVGNRVLVALIEGRPNDVIVIDRL